MILYGLYGFTHGWARVLTVMASDGAEAVAAHIDPGPDVIATTGQGRLPLYQEKREGALAVLVSKYGIEVLEKAEWDAKKAELGRAVL